MHDAELPMVAFIEFRALRNNVIWKVTIGALSEDEGSVSRCAGHTCRQTSSPEECFGERGLMTGPGGRWNLLKYDYGIISIEDVKKGMNDIGRVRESGVLKALEPRRERSIRTKLFLGLSPTEARIDLKSHPACTERLAQTQAAKPNPLQGAIREEKGQVHWRLASRHEQMVPTDQAHGRKARPRNDPGDSAASTSTSCCLPMGRMVPPFRKNGNAQQGIVVGIRVIADGGDGELYGIECYEGAYRWLR
ncbi:hypothetical protein BKA70DRAFT_1403307 [Coprinopsis sp. MPI-PUGE-AT-0042]|nr:hypothetical protein BKA70DRAFT_1403307 [Coprinopsis sp. MPI-PUGE-AT-0042]